MCAVATLASRRSLSLSEQPMNAHKKAVLCMFIQSWSVSLKNNRQPACGTAQDAVQVVEAENVSKEKATIPFRMSSERARRWAVRRRWRRRRRRRRTSRKRGGGGQLEALCRQL
jgi:hypothetical protein